MRRSPYEPPRSALATAMKWVVILAVIGGIIWASVALGLFIKHSNESRDQFFQWCHQQRGHVEYMKPYYRCFSEDGRLLS